jgi:hypothetical protein
MRIASLSLLTICCLMLAVAPAMADSTLYENGPLNGTTDAWTINFGFAVSNSFQLSNASGVQINSLDIWVWNANSDDLLSTVDAQFGSVSFGGTVHTFQQDGIHFGGTNQYGYDLEEYHFDFAGIPWNGPGFITLSNACTNSGCSVSNPIYWDENSGVGCTSPGCPSTAYEKTIGSIPSLPW